MKEALITFETAKAAKAAGFKTHIAQFNAAYDREGHLVGGVRLAQAPNLYREEGFQAVSQAVLQKWLREEQERHIVLIPTITSHWTYKVVLVLHSRSFDSMGTLTDVQEEPPYKEVCGYDFSTYEEALEAALLETLTLLNPASW